MSWNPDPDFTDDAPFQIERPEDHAKAIYEMTDWNNVYGRRVVPVTYGPATGPLAIIETETVGWPFLLGGVPCIWLADVAHPVRLEAVTAR